MSEAPSQSRKLPPSSRWLAGIAGAAVAWAAQAQPVPYSSLGRDSTPQQTTGSPLRDALQAARSGNVSRAQELASALNDPAARKLILWAQVDAMGQALPLETLQLARTELAGWPHAPKRQAAFEHALETGGASPSTVIAAFGSGQPDTAEGAIALATALDGQGRTAEAQTLVRNVWRNKTFDADVQARMYNRFSRWIADDDIVFRLDSLLYQGQGAAVAALIPFVDADHQAAARARMGFRQGQADAASGLSPAMQSEPGVIWEQARYLQAHGQELQAVQMLKGVGAPQTQDAAAYSWTPRRQLLNIALKNHDGVAGYYVIASHGLKSGADYVEAEAFLGWLALNKLHDAKLADAHFQNVLRMGSAPVTVSRGYYWRGRAAEALGDQAAAQAFYEKGGVYTTAFYGQLSAEKAGLTRLRLPADPIPTAADRATFSEKSTVQAARLLAETGDRELLRTFVLSIADSLPDAGQYALLTDFARSTGDIDLAMRVARASGVHGYPLPERGWPVRATPEGGGRPEAAFSLAIARQESNFDPNARSAFARGLMQLRPETGAVVARKLGLPYSAARLEDPEFNMTLGSAYLGGIVDGFSGSYVMAAAGYNAGPGRPAQWVQDCGDPRQSSADPADFIECIPFTETRNYVMRVMENTAVYRARLNGGEAALTASEDLHRGSWSPGYARATTSFSGNASGPIPYSQLTPSGPDPRPPTATLNAGAESPQP